MHEKTTLGEFGAQREREFAFPFRGRGRPEMPMVHEIKIEPVVDGQSNRTGYRYVPQPPDPASGPTAARPGDQVFWRNDDSQAHWPAAQGVQFMPNQIAPNSSSQAWVADKNANTLTYQDTLDTSGSPPTGTIVVSSTAGGV